MGHQLLLVRALDRLTRLIQPSLGVPPFLEPTRQLAQLKGTKQMVSSRLLPFPTGGEDFL